MGEGLGCRAGLGERWPGRVVGVVGGCRGSCWLASWLAGLELCAMHPHLCCF